jgi:hypothetical protein
LRPIIPTEVICIGEVPIEDPETGAIDLARIIRETPVRGVFVAEVSAKFDFGFALTAIFA